MKETKQICTTIDSDLYSDIQEMADDENRKLAQMAAVLLHAAVKERKRNRNKNRKNAKEESAG